MDICEDGIVVAPALPIPSKVRQTEHDNMHLFSINADYISPLLQLPYFCPDPNDTPVIASMRSKGECEKIRPSTRFLTKVHAG